MKFLAVSGNAGTGKDYITRHLLVPMLTGGRPYAIASFADHFKLESIVKEKLDRDKVYGRKDKHTRIRLQIKGTEEGRDLYGPNLWVEILDERLKQYEERGIHYVFITDCRFPNEIEYVKSRKGKIIRINAQDRHNKAMQIENGGDCNVTGHISENALNEYKQWDFEVDNSEANSLYVADQIRDICLNLREEWKYPETVFCDLDDTLVECSKHYQEIQRKIRTIFIEEKIMSPFQFDSTFNLAQSIIQNKNSFSREGYAKMFIDFLKSKREDLVDRVRDIAMGIYNCEFSLKSYENLEFIRTLDTHLVILTVGDPVDEIRKLYKIGFTNVEVECVVCKDANTYSSLMRKYPSHNYRVIGDSSHSNIQSARQAGIEDIFLLSSVHSNVKQ